MTAPAWMPFYVADYLADTGHLSTVEHGAYMLLIMHYWQNGGLPIDDHKLARVCRMTIAEWSAARDTLSDLFDDGWRHGRIDREIASASETMSKRSAAGKHAASVRYANRMRSAVQSHAPSEGEGEGTNLDNTPTEKEVASPREGTTSAPMARLEFASTFWPAFPNKVGRRAAEEAFVTARRKASLPEIMDGLARYKSDKPPDRQWLNPATFLNQERWNDEPAPALSRQPTGKPEPPHDAIYRVLARHAEEGDRGSERPAGVAGRIVDHREPEAVDRGGHRVVPRPPYAATG